MIEAGPVMRLLYLGNNYHALHHARPALPWYRLAAAYRKARPRLQVETGGYVFRGYSDLFRAFFFNPRDAGAHP